MGEVKKGYELSHVLDYCCLQQRAIPLEPGERRPAFAALDPSPSEPRPSQSRLSRGKEREKEIRQHCQPFTGHSLAARTVRARWCHS